MTRLLRCSFLLIALTRGLAAEEDREALLRERVAALEKELAAARAELAACEESKPAVASSSAKAALTETPEATEEETDDRIRIGNLTIGGAMRVNWTLGDYETGASGPSRGGHGGDFALDNFRINLDYTRDALFGKAEYRWYPGTNFFHTLELGYQPEETTKLRGGLTRVPFGVGAYGPSNSWFFDQHYYVGLSDDMDLGLVYTTHPGDWTLDLGVFFAAEPNMRGASDGGARYSFDIVDARHDPNYFGNQTPTGYAERGQFNLRAVRSFPDLALPTDLGTSLQLGHFDGRGGMNDAWPFAASLHSLSTLGPWALKLQATHYDYDSAEDHITGGFYDYTTDIASEGTLLSAALSYTWEKPVSWLDSITFYNDFSVIRKYASGYHDSALNVLGAGIARGGWYIYVDWAYSNGNEFVGDFRPGMLSDNPDSDWQSRYNINFGYYF